MSRPAKRTAKPNARKPSRLKQAAKQVATDADQVRQDLGKLLLSLEDLSVESLREVADRALVLIAEKTGGERRSLIAGVMDTAMSVGGTITGLFVTSDAPPKKRRVRRARNA